MTGGARPVRRYMAVERFRDPDGAAVYDRFRRRGRLLPDGLIYLDSWVDRRAGVCFQLIETGDPALFDIWTAAWVDLVAFEIHEVGRTEDQA